MDLSYLRQTIMIFSSQHEMICRQIVNNSSVDKETKDLIRKLINEQNHFLNQLLANL